MKTFKFNSSLFILCFFALSIFMTSCSSDEDTTAPITSNTTENLKKSLESDPDFYLLQTLDNDLLNEVSKAMTKAGLDASDMKAAFENEESAEKVTKALSDSNAEQIEAQISAVAARLDAKYSSLAEDPLSEAELIERRTSGFQSIGSDPEIINRWCNWKYYACRAAAYGGYFACLTKIPRWVCRIGSAYAARWCKNRYC